MIFRTVFLSFLFILAAGCITQPKQTLETNVPPDLNKNDVELAILLATGLVTPEPGEHKTWSEFEKACFANAGRLQIGGPDLQDEDHWVFEMSSPSSVLTSYNDGSERLGAKVDYDAKKIRISITESRNLDEKAGNIDPRANEWIDELRSKINRGLGRVQLMKRNFDHH